MFDVIFAWSWGGHGELTTVATAMAIVKLAASGKAVLLKKLAAFASKDLTSHRFVKPAGEADIEAGVVTVKKSPATDLEKDLAELFAPLPGQVQTEDLHPGNIPYVGEYLQSDSQVRHFMKSDTSTTGIEAYNKSKAYIREKLDQAYSRMREATNAAEHWYSPNGPLHTFQDGIGSLAAALHTLEDSYAPGHVTRLDTLFWIKTIHVWDQENRDGDPSHAIPSHEAFDNPRTPKSVPFFEEAKVAASDFIFCVLSNLDQTPEVYARACDAQIDAHLSVIISSNL